MHKYVLVCLLMLSVMLLLSRRTVKLVNLRRLFLPVLCIVFISGLIMFSRSSVNAAVKGIELWLYIVFPSLFPFFVASELLYRTGFVKALGILLEPVMRPLFNVPGCGSFPFAMGITSGYPVGAKITAGMRKSKMITKLEAERLLAFTNNSGPLFIVGAVSVGMFGMPELGLLLLFCHIASCITIGILFRFYGRKKERIMMKNMQGGLWYRFRQELRECVRNSSGNLGGLFGDSVMSSISTILAIGGFIIFFSVIINLLLDTGIISGGAKVLHTFLSPLGLSPDTIKALLSGIFEITTGTKAASIAKGADLAQRAASAAVIIGWAGLSVHFQVMSIISDTDIDAKPYLAGKLLQGILAGIYTFIAMNSFIDTSIDGSWPVFSAYNSGAAIPGEWRMQLGASISLLAAAAALITAAILLSVSIWIVLRLWKAVVMYIQGITR